MMDQTETKDSNGKLETDAQPLEQQWADERKERIDIVKCLLEKQWKELDYRRERENKLAVWLATLLEVATAWVTSKPPQTTDPSVISSLFSIVAAGLTTLSGVFLIENRKRYEDTQQVLVRLQDVLTAWKAERWSKTWTHRNEWIGQALLPDDWRGWGKFGSGIMPRLDTITHIAAVWLVAAVGTLAVHGTDWPSGIPYLLIPLTSFIVWIQIVSRWSKVMDDNKRPSNANDQPNTDNTKDKRVGRAFLVFSVFLLGGFWFLPIWVLGWDLIVSVVFEGVASLAGSPLWVRWCGLLGTMVVLPLLYLWVILRALAAQDKKQAVSQLASWTIF